MSLGFQIQTFILQGRTSVDIYGWMNLCPSNESAASNGQCFLILRYVLRSFIKDRIKEKNVGLKKKKCKNKRKINKQKEKILKDILL